MKKCIMKLHVRHNERGSAIALCFNLLVCAYMCIVRIYIIYI